MVLKFQEYLFGTPIGFNLDKGEVRGGRGVDPEQPFWKTESAASQVLPRGYRVGQTRIWGNAPQED